MCVILRIFGTKVCYNILKSLIFFLPKILNIIHFLVKWNISRLCTKGGMVAIVTSASHTSHIATMSLEVHTTFFVQIGGKSRVACECVVSRGQSSFVRYGHFARWSGWYEHYRPLKRAVWTFRPILTPRYNWLHAALRTSMQCDSFRPFGHKINSNLMMQGHGYLVDETTSQPSLKHF